MDSQVERLRWLVRTRGIVAPLTASLVVMIAVMTGVSLARLTESLILALGVSGYNLLFCLALPRLRSARGWAVHGWLQILLDLGVITALVHYSGGIGSPLFLMYFVHIVSASSVLWPGGTYLAAVLSSAMYGLLLLAEYTGLIVRLPSFFSGVNGAITADQPSAWAGYFLFVVGLLHVCAFVTEYLAGLVRATERRTRQQLVGMTTLFNASAMLAASLELGDVLRCIAEQMAQALDATSCYVSDWNMANGTWTELAECVGPQAAPKERVSDLGVTVRVDDYPLVAAGLCALQPVLIRVNDPMCDAAYRAHLVEYGGKTALLIPLVIHDEIFGYIETWDSRREREFTPDEIWLAQMFATQAAAAIENAQLYERVKQRTAEVEATARNLELVHQVSNLVSSSLDLTQVLATSAEQMVRLFEVDHSGILIFDEMQTYGQVIAEYPVIGAEAVRYPVQGYLAAERIIADPQPLVIENAQHDPLMAAVREAMVQLDIRSILIVPLVIRNKTIGSIGLDAIAAPRRFTPSEVALVQTIANQVSIAIENAHLYRAERDQRELAETLRKVGATLVSTLDVDTVLDRLLEQVGRVVPSDTTNVMLIEGEYARIVRWRGYERFGIESIMHTVSLPLASVYSLQRMIETRSPVIVPDTHAEPSWVHTLEMQWLRSYAGAPICVRGEAIGFLNVDSDTPRLFGQSHAERLRAFADQAAVALENARLYAQVRAEQEQLRAVLESAGDAIIVTDAQGVILLFNPAAERAFGLAAEQVIECPLFDAVPALAEPARRERWPTEAHALHCEIPFSNGQTLFCDLEPVREADGKLRGWVGVLHDVTHFKELDRIKSELIATVSHDLRNPLHLTRGYFNVLVEALGPLAHDKQIWVDTVHRALRRMDALITDLLDLEKIQAGAGLSRELCNLGLVITDAIAELETQAADKHVTLNVEIPLTLPPVWGDPRWLAQVFQNLLDNALKYTRRGDSVTLCARAEPTTVIVGVADTGTGIAADDLAHIFERFYRARRPMVQAKGTGLGLAIVKSIVEQHGGRVWAESQAGQGSTFYVALPIAPVDAERTARPDGG